MLPVHRHIDTELYDVTSTSACFVIGLISSSVLVGCLLRPRDGSVVVSPRCVDRAVICVRSHVVRRLFV